LLSTHHYAATTLKPGIQHKCVGARKIRNKSCLLFCAKHLLVTAISQQEEPSRPQTGD
jgi:hypothetical protein